MKKLFTPLIAMACICAPWVMKAQTTTLTFAFTQAPELTADAGADDAICNGEVVTLGGSPSSAGGTAPVTYSWSPTDSLSSASVANPTADPSDTTTYVLTVTDGSNCTASASVTISVDTCVSVSEIAGLASVVLYPNPNKGNFKVNASLQKKVENFSLSVVTLNGVEVYSTTRVTPAMLFTEEVSLPGIARGVYIVKMDFDGSILERKIIVQ